MSFAGVSVIVDGKLVHATTSPTTASASGYHLLVVEGQSRTPEPIKSRCFIIGGHRWYIMFYPNDEHLNNNGYITLWLHLDKEEAPATETVKAQFKFSFVDETDKHKPACIHGRKLSEFEAGGNDEGREAMGKSEHLKDDSFTIRCDIVVVTEEVITTTGPTATASSLIVVPPSNMQRNFTDLLLTGEGTDVAFRVGGETFAAHRCVLAAWSTVFRALLFGPMKEGTSAMVQIDDMDAAVFKAMLGFIYGDSLPAPAVQDEDVVMLHHLLATADRYDLLRLRMMCEKKLCEHINVSTAAVILAVAEQHGCEGLKKACSEFLRCPDNLRAVLATDGFDHLCRSCPTLMKDMILGVLPPAG
ncbi:BTB/POZ and MATH domain-containing protein 2-like [Triticum dicoccoides]|uniref:BTB/POZ and MATH domain-containing protein 2-like n=1 Tax=Triticum dicoccoides TaxID=85692 RepID=UPI001890D358|nr:BTB/POZ and MATH domain-containing protein 2-like [Triticum dicoccoides]